MGEESLELAEGPVDERFDPDGGQQDGSGGSGRHSGPGSGAVFVYYLVTAVNVAALLAVGVWVLLQPPSWPTQVASLPKSPRTPLAESRIRRAVDVYQLAEQRPPSSLEPLHTRGLLRRTDLYYPDGKEMWVYRRGDRDFRLVRVETEK